MATNLLHSGQGRRRQLRHDGKLLANHAHEGVQKLARMTPQGLNRLLRIGVGTKYRESNRNYREPNQNLTNRNIRFHVRFRVFKNRNTEVNTETVPNLPKVPKSPEIE